MACFNAGMTMRETAAALNIPAYTVEYNARKNGLKFAQAKMGRPDTADDHEAIPAPELAKSLGRAPDFTGGEMIDAPASPIGTIINCIIEAST